MSTPRPDTTSSGETCRRPAPKKTRSSIGIEVEISDTQALPGGRSRCLADLARARACSARGSERPRSRWPLSTTPPSTGSTAAPRPRLADRRDQLRPLRARRSGARRRAGRLGRDGRDDRRRDRGRPDWPSWRSTWSMVCSTCAVMMTRPSRVGVMRDREDEFLQRRILGTGRGTALRALAGAPRPARPGKEGATRRGRADLGGDARAGPAGAVLHLASVALTKALQSYSRSRLEEYCASHGHPARADEVAHLDEQTEHGPRRSRCSPGCSSPR